MEHFEGYRAEPYLCPAKIPTIGYGTTHYSNGKKVTLQDEPITKERALEILKYQANRVYGSAVNIYVQVPITQNQFDALVSFAYNLGIGAFRTSTLLKRVNQQQYEKAAKEFHKWVYSDGKKLKGLVKRRKAEADLFQRSII